MPDMTKQQASKRGYMLVASILLLGAAFWIGGNALEKEGANDDLEVRVKGVTLDPVTQSPVVLLEDLGHSKAFPIWIGSPEALSIASQLERVRPPRPNSHDLMKSILDQLQGTVLKVVITELKNNTYYALLEIRVKGSTVSIDSRPSDAIALALRVKAPIFTSRKVWNEAKVIDLANRKEGVSGKTVGGLVLQELTSELARHFGAGSHQGVLVSDVIPGSPGERAGIRRGDIIAQINGKTVRSLKDFEAALEEGEKDVTVVQLFRQGTQKTISLPGRP